MLGFPLHKHNILFLLPLFGTICFCICFYVSTLYYPGGSQFEVDSIGYSWEHNYWCNLLYKNALNGKRNDARPIAILAMIFLNVSIGSFWYIFPKKVKLTLNKRHIIQISGISSMVIATFISSKLHDLIIFLSSVLGIVALIGTLYGLYKLKWSKLLYYGIFNLFLIFCNFILYFEIHLIYYLPILQKITFFLFLVWISVITYKMYQK